LSPTSLNCSISTCLELRRTTSLWQASEPIVHDWRLSMFAEQPSHKEVLRSSLKGALTLGSPRAPPWSILTFSILRSFPLLCTRWSPTTPS
jgi:hypothetical protein